MEILDFKELLVRKPWFRPSAESVYNADLSVTVTNKFNAVAPPASVKWNMYLQEDMIREYYPSGHKIKDKVLYPDIWKEDPETGKYYQQPITRCTIAFQQIIATKHIIHLCGNDVQFELSESSSTKGSDEEKNALLSEFRHSWLKHDMEIRFYEAIRSLKITSEACLVGYIKNGKFGCKMLSFINDDTLYPHYDSLTGDIDMFARRYFDYDDDGSAVTEWVEVWDDRKYYRAKKDVKENSVIKRLKDVFGLNGYRIVDEIPHGFNFVPVAYYREEEGPCWAAAQDTIEHYEEAVSYFFENNKAFAFPILTLTGEGIEVNGDDMTGGVKSITIDSPDGKASFLEGNDVSASYKALLDLMYNAIYEQAFAVKPPELKSGDLPGVALKLLYSPAIERAIDDAQRIQPFLDKLVLMVKYGCGLESENRASLLSLDINAWIEPYVHQNDTELVTNLTTCVQNNILSKQTASERNSKFSRNDEFNRIMAEIKEKQQMEIEKEGAIKEKDTNEEIRKAKATSKGSDINTGGGAGGNRTRTTDKWGNHEGENNWENWNKQH